MEYIVDTEGITLVKSDKGGYTIVFYDLHGHYEEEVNVRKDQLCDLLKGLEKIRDDINESGIM